MSEDALRVLLAVAVDAFETTVVDVIASGPACVAVVILGVGTFWVVNVTFGTGVGEVVTTGAGVVSAAVVDIQKRETYNFCINYTLLVIYRGVVGRFWTEHVVTFLS